jgi:hypothetical protein
MDVLTHALTIHQPYAWAHPEWRKARETQR